MRPRPVVGKATVPEAVRRLLDKFDYPDRESPPQVIPVLPSLGSAGGIGAFIHLTRNATQSIASAGEPISWDALGLQGVSGFIETVPTTTVTIEQAGYYNVAIQLGWSSFTEGGTITVLKNGLIVWPPTDDPGLWSATDGQLFEGTAHGIDCLVGDTLSVNVNPDDASAQTLASATLTAYLVDRAANAGLYRELVLSHEPLAYWRLDDTSGTTATDEMGNYDGTYVDTPTLNQPGVMQDGSDSPSVEFDGANEYVDVDDIADALAGLTELTIEAWIEADALDGAVFKINRDFPATTGDNVYGITVGPAGQLGWGDQDDNHRSAVGLISVDTRHYVAATRDSSNVVRLYIDGGLVHSESTAGTTALATDEAQIGMDWDDLGGIPSETQHFDGHIDEVAVYTRELSAAEIQQHYRTGRSG